MAGRSIATQRTTCPSLSLVYRQALQAHLHFLLQHLHRRKPKLLHSIPHQQEVRVQVALREYGETRRVNQKNTKTSIKNKDNERVRGDPLCDLPEWYRASTVLKLTSRRTEIAISASEPKLQGLLAANALVQSCLERKIWVILITADHKVLSEGCESRNNHRYAVVVQDLATQWIQSYLCKTNISQETQKSLQMFLEPTRKPKIIYTDNSLEFGKYCEDLSWNLSTSTPHRSDTNGIAERAVRRVK